MFQMCRKCPLKNLWAPQPVEATFRAICEEYYKSPWVKWSEAKTQKTRKKYAGIIAEYAEKELAKLRGGVQSDG
jgi:hypothetical protein